MKIAYADPPYIGCAHLYRDHPDYAGEVDHVHLIERLERDYDGWILHAARDAALHRNACPAGREDGRAMDGVGEGICGVQAQYPGRLCVGAGHREGSAKACRQQAVGDAGLDSGEHHASPWPHWRVARSGLPLGFRDGCRASRRHARRPVSRHRGGCRSMAHMAAQIRFAGRAGGAFRSASRCAGSCSGWSRIMKAGGAEKAGRAEGKIKEDGTISGRFRKLLLSAHCLGEPRAAPWFSAPRAAISRKALALLGFERHHRRISACFRRVRPGPRP
jgi:hypothetical protein